MNKIDASISSRRDPRYDILFEPVKIGPVMAKNRFYQVPHCNGMGHQFPSSMAEMRGVKAEGGWAVVCTEQVEIHHTSELTPVVEGRFWDDADIPVMARMCDKIHEHGGLAGIEPCYDGYSSPNRFSREAPMGPSARPVTYLEPVQSRAMDKTDIRNVRRYYVDAAKRARTAGFDIIYVYAAHDLSVLSQFFSRRWNDRGDEYGGSFENRARLFREVLQDTKDAVGDTCGIAVRFGVDEMMGEEGIEKDGEGRDFIELMAEEPDLWDVNVSDWDNDSLTSRFGASGFQDDYVSFVKSVTTKPVVGVGRYTSPDAMVSLIKGGKLDLIGAARPSIADPFLPKKIEEGRIEDIRECIGCNICVSADFHMVPLRCTQNPTMGEEWRKGWHPERIAPKAADESVLIIGGGPSGLEAARALGQRGYAVTLAEAGDVIGGRVAREAKLPGLTEWKRVADYREYQISQMANVETYLQSPLTAAQALEFGADHIFVATGAKWRRDGVGRANVHPIEIADGANVLTPDDVMDGAIQDGPVAIFDDDHYYMGGIMAELLRAKGLEVTLVTPAADVSNWTHNTLEQHRIQSRLMTAGVKIMTNHSVTAVGVSHAVATCGYTDVETRLEAAATIMVTMRLPVDDLFAALVGAEGPKSVTRIGDCLAPGTIAAAVYAGHKYARELGEVVPAGTPFRRELIRLSAD
ncbi:MAG: FAD-dependent oxidoreductase [Pseudomonadota bacterium]